MNDILNKLKTRFVTKDFSQMFEMNYIDIFVLTIKFDIFCLFFVVVVLKDFECHQMNVNNIFTKSFLKKIIYMKFSFDVDLFFEQTFLIRRNLYELKQEIKN